MSQKQFNPGDTVTWNSKTGPVDSEWRGRIGDQATIIVRNPGESPYQITVPTSQISKKMEQGKSGTGENSHVSQFGSGSEYMQSWQRAKDQSPGALVAMRDGDTYRFHGDDAEKAEKILGTHEIEHGEHADAVHKLVQAGHRVAIAEQVPKAPGGAEVDRQVAPGSMVEPTFQPNMNAGLHRSLHSMTGAAQRWESRRAKGMTDAELREAVSEEFGNQGGHGGDSNNPGSFSHYGGSSPRFEESISGSKLSGKKLLAAARAVLDIPQPKPEQAPAKAPESKPGSTHYEVDGTHYGDTDLIHAAGKHFDISHMGFGDFAAKTPHGRVTFSRTGREAQNGGVGREHVIGGDKNAVQHLLEKIGHGGLVQKSVRYVAKSIGADSPVHTHPLPGYPQKMHQFQDAPHTVTSVLHGPNNTPLTHEHHSALAAHHARMAAGFRAAGQHSMAQSHFAAARFHHASARMKRTPGALQKPQAQDVRALGIGKSLVHAHDRRAPQTGEMVHVAEYTNKVQKHPEQIHAPTVRAGVPTRAPVAGHPQQFHYTPGVKGPGQAIGETSSGMAIHADSHANHAGWGRTEHWEAAQAHNAQAASLERIHRENNPHEGEVGAAAHPSDESRKAVAHRARAAYHSRLADNDSKGAAAIAKYDHRFREHLQGHQAEEQPLRNTPSVQGDEHDSEKFISNMVEDILAGAQDLGGGRLSVDTQKLHMDKATREYKPARATMHKRVLEARLSQAEPAEQPECVFLGGGSASGKGTIQKSGQLTLPKGAITCDSDLMKTGDPEGDETGIAFPGIPEFGQLALGGNADKAAAFVHEESSDMNAQLLSACLSNKYHVVVDGTGDSTGSKIKQKIDAAKVAGHKVRAVYCTVPTDDAVKRSMERAKNMEKEGKPVRRVLESAVREIHMSVSRVFPEVKDLFDDLELYDTNVPKGQPGRLIYSRKPGRGETIHNPELYQAFLDKGKEDPMVEKWDTEAHDWKPEHKGLTKSMSDKNRKRKKRKAVIWIPGEWPDHDRLVRARKAIEKMGLHEHHKRKRESR